VGSTKDFIHDRAWKG